MRFKEFINETSEKEIENKYRGKIMLPLQWAALLGVTIKSPDGWRDMNGNLVGFHDIPIAFNDFQQKLMKSTIG